MEDRGACEGFVAVDLRRFWIQFVHIVGIHSARVSNRSEAVAASLSILPKIQTSRQIQNSPHVRNVAQGVC